ncbi:hypothetical protein [Candidatus Enterococcus clewellii]|uniref:Uncharacterized protein n=1 Tax=Candidatus Enterococcus clewellii TaxID=1834193 RepID=A0A242K3V5_9ENTE|nr:hypothetical protein [Enterococcus sp. 9E7_DIV0242]OTP13677.1 hypothetical protein A5888_003155 [Enterococcus sp. 9E7_DIV0242]
MKNRITFIGAICSIALGMLLVAPVTAQAWGNEGKYVHFFDSDVRLPLTGQAAEFTREKYDEQIEQFNKKYQKDYDALYTNHDKEQAELNDLMAALDERHSNGEITEEEYAIEYDKLQADLETLENEFTKKIEAFETKSEEELEKLEKQQQEEEAFIETYELPTKEFLVTVDTISTELLSLNPSLSGLEYVPNLKYFTGEISREWTVSDTRSLLNTPKLEILHLPISNQTNLNSMKNLIQLKELHLEAGGYANKEEEHIQETMNDERYTEALLTDISALSNATNLKKLSVSAEGAMPVVTLRKGTTSYELVDPIVLSSQFDGATLSYYSYLDETNYSYASNDLLKWEGLTGEEDMLLFDWDVSQGQFGFRGIGQIPIRWK